MDTVTAALSGRCGYHHQPAILCHQPELGDVLDQLRELRIDARIVGRLPWLDECGGCAEQGDWPPNDAVATVVHITHPAGRRYSETTCAACLRETVAWHRRNASKCWVEIPAAIGAAA